jgi:hypothetical protein
VRLLLTDGSISRMIISHKYKFIFIKTQKTAGTSIEIFLSQVCGAGDIFTPIYPHVDPHEARNYRGLWNPLPELGGKNFQEVPRFTKDLMLRRRFYNHISARDIRWRLSRRTWNQYYKFCVERNPWDKTLSHYYMVNDRAGGRMSFEEYLASGNFCNDFNLYTDENGKLIVDRVIKYESLVGGLGEVFGHLGVRFDGTLGVRAKSEHRQDRSSYRDIYNESQRATIDREFSMEIAMLGYSF